MDSVYYTLSTYPSNHSSNHLSNRFLSQHSSPNLSLLLCVRRQDKNKWPDTQIIRLQWGRGDGWLELFYLQKQKRATRLGSPFFEWGICGGSHARDPIRGIPYAHARLGIKLPLPYKMEWLLFHPLKRKKPPDKGGFVLNWEPGNVLLSHGETPNYHRR